MDILLLTVHAGPEPGTFTWNYPLQCVDFKPKGRRPVIHLALDANKDTLEGALAKALRYARS